MDDRTAEYIITGLLGTAVLIYMACAAYSGIKFYRNDRRESRERNLKKQSELEDSLEQ